MLKKISDIQTNVKNTNRRGTNPATSNALIHWNVCEKRQPALTSLETINKSGELCELACDLTMMAQKFVKLDGKYGGNKGFDGLYKGDDIIVAAESKHWGSPPTLHTVIAEKIIPKFDFVHSGAIKHINEKSVNKISAAYEDKKVYMLAYAMLADGQIDCRLEHFIGDIKFPQTLVKIQSTSNQHQLIATPHTVASKIKIEPKNDEVSDEIKTPEPIGYDLSMLTPQSNPEDMQKVLDNLLSSFREKAGISSTQLSKMLNQSNILNIEPIPFSLEEIVA